MKKLVIGSGGTGCSDDLEESHFRPSGDGYLFCPFGGRTGPRGAVYEISKADKPRLKTMMKRANFFLHSLAFELFAAIAVLASFAMAAIFRWRSGIATFIVLGITYIPFALGFKFLLVRPLVRGLSKSDKIFVPMTAHPTPADDSELDKSREAPAKAIQISGLMIAIAVLGVGLVLVTAWRHGL